MQNPMSTGKKYDKRPLKNLYSILSFSKFKQNVWLKQNNSLLIKLICFYKFLFLHLITILISV